MEYEKVDELYILRIANSLIKSNYLVIKCHFDKVYLIKYVYKKSIFLSYEHCIVKEKKEH